MASVSASTTSASSGVERLERTIGHISADLPNGSLTVPKASTASATVTASATAGYNASSRVATSSDFTPWSDRNFFDLYAHQYVRCCAVVPSLHLADPIRNATVMIDLYANGNFSQHHSCLWEML
jgi:hypothetical protein